MSRVRGFFTPRKARRERAQARYRLEARGALWD